MYKQGGDDKVDSAYIEESINIVLLEIDLRNEKTYSKDMLDKLRNRVRLAEMEGYLK